MRVRPAAFTIVILSLLLVCVESTQRLKFDLLFYPFFFPDSFDWLSNGLRYSSKALSSFEISHRAMFLPLLIALAYDFGFENMIVLVGLLALAATVLLAYFGLRKLGFERESLLVALGLLLSFTMLGQSAYLGADVAANAAIVAAVLFLSYALCNGSSPSFVAFTVTFSLGLHLQYIGFILAPFWLFAFFLNTKNGSLSLGFGNLARLWRSGAILPGLIAGALALFLPLLPRLLAFKLFYTEKVQHTSLLHFNLDDPYYYLLGLFANYSWPILALAAIGCFSVDSSSTQPAKQRWFKFLCIVWLLNIFIFFQFFYSWKDIRLLVYLSFPLFFLASSGFLTIWKLLAIQSSRVVTVTAKALLLAIATYFIHSPPTTDPWDLNFALTPWTALGRNADGEFKLSKHKSLPFLWQHWQELENELQIRRHQDFDVLMASRPLFNLFDKLRVKNEIRPHKTFYFGSFTPDSFYIAKNRNILYARSDVVTTSDSDLIARMATSSESTIIAHREDLKKLGADLAVNFDAFKPLAQSGAYSAVRANEDFFASKQELPPIAAQISSIHANENKFALFNGIHDQAGDYSASPLGQPIEVFFSSSLSARTLVVHLWDFDERAYRFSVEALIDADDKPNWTSLQKPEALLKGKVLIALPPKKFSALRLVGVENTDVARIPGNTVFHIKELEIIQ